MEWIPNDDPNDPIRRSYQIYSRRIRKALLCIAAIAAFLVLFGVPSVQWNYRTYSSSSFPSAREKLDADYWNPFSGPRTFKAGELGQGCPMVVMMPLKYCMDFSAIKNPVTVFLFGEELFSECSE